MPNKLKNKTLSHAKNTILCQKKLKFKFKGYIFNQLKN